MTPFLRLTLICLCLAQGLHFPVVHAQTSGEDGVVVGQELLEQGRAQVQAISHDAEGGVRDSGTITIQGTGTIDVNDIVPGADRARVKQLTEFTLPESGVSVEAAKAMQRSVKEDSNHGDAARVLFNNNRMSREEVLRGGLLEQSIQSIADAQSGDIESLFADCTTVASVEEGDPITSVRRSYVTCSTGQVASACVRKRHVTIRRRPDVTTTVFLPEVVREEPKQVRFQVDVDESDPSMFPTSFRVIQGKYVFGTRLVQTPSAANDWAGIVETGFLVPQCWENKCRPSETFSRVEMTTPGDVLEVNQTVERNGACEAEAQTNQCTIGWSCSQEGAKTVDGVVVDRAFARRHQLADLLPGVDQDDQAMCWEGRAQVSCPVCATDGNGVRRCQPANISASLDATCGALAKRSDCALDTKTCLISGPGSQCLSWAMTYACEETVTSHPLSTVTTTNTCGASIQCLGDGCRSEKDLAGEPADNSIQRVAASLALTDTIINDWAITNTPGDSDSGGGSSGGDDQHNPDNRTGDTIIAQSSGRRRIPDRHLDNPDRSGSMGNGASGNDGSLGARWGYDAPDARDRAVGDSLAFDTSGLGAIADNIQLFKGNPHKCKEGWGGLVECCSKTNTDAPGRYWSIYQRVSAKRMGQSLLAGDDGRAGGWSSLSSGRPTLAALRQSLTSVRENVTGGGDASAFAGVLAEVHATFMAQARAEIKPNLSPSWLCSDQEFDLAVQREVGMCSYAGTYCSSKVLGVCLQRKEAYCCYSSPMSKMLRASVDGGSLEHGSPKAPDCRGIPLDRLDEIDWDTIPFDELIGRMDEGGALPSSQERDDALERYTGYGKVVGGAGRENVVERTRSRMAAIDDPAIREQLAYEASLLKPVLDRQVVEGLANISFSPSFVTLEAGKRNTVRLSRQGGQGPVSATVQLVQGDAQSLGFYSETVKWSAGETADKSLVFDVAPSAAGMQFKVEITSVQGGQPGDSPQLTAKVRER